MKFKPFFLFISIVIISSCSVDYDFNNTKSNEPELIIVNSLLSPSKPIQVRLHKLEIAGDKYGYKGLQGAKVTLKEGQLILYDTVCNDSILSLNHYPKVDMDYSIEVSYGNLQTAKATTSVPPPITCNSDFSYDEVYRYSSSYVITLRSFQIPSTPKIALWITAYRVFEDNEEIQYNELYANNVLIDKRNSTAGMEAINNTVGSIYYNGFLRIKNKNLNLVQDIQLTPNFVYIEDYTDPEAEQTKIRVKLITASPEYDQFQKTLYEQKSMIVFEDDFSSVFYQPKAVYTNIENGLGIFAAVNEASQLINLPFEDD